MCVNADGVHLGQASIPAYAVRKIIGDKMMIGVSTHNQGEALTAENEGADFITFGPIYPTLSKLKYGKPVGVESLKKIAERVGIPIFGIGGIKPDNTKEVLDAGAYGVAVISGILRAADIKTAARKYLKILGE
jgi:thiamine-phosphate pyrophosphorylase